jgi:hypothetical protein
MVRMRTFFHYEASLQLITIYLPGSSLPGGALAPLNILPLSSHIKYVLKNVIGRRGVRGEAGIAHNSRLVL